MSNFVEVESSQCNFFWYSASSILLCWQHLWRDADRPGVWCHAPPHTPYILSDDTYPSLLCQFFVCFLLETPCVDKIPKDIPINCHLECWTPSACCFILIYLQVVSLLPNKQSLLRASPGSSFNSLREKRYTNWNNQKGHSFEVIPLDVNRTSWSPLNLWEQYKYSDECVSLDWHPINLLIFTSTCISTQDFQRFISLTMLKIQSMYTATECSSYYDKNFIILLIIYTFKDNNEYFAKMFVFLCIF